MHAWQWHQTVAGSVPQFQKAGTQLTARAAAASCCEFNWSDFDDVIGKRRTGLRDDRQAMLVRARATRRLKEQVHLFEPDRQLPELADSLEELLNERQAAATHLQEAADDVASDEEVADEAATHGTDVEDCCPMDDDDCLPASDDSESGEEGSDDDEGERFDPDTHYNPANVTVGA